MRVEDINITAKKQSDLFEKIDMSLKKAVKNAILQHKQAGHSIHIMVDNRVVEIMPEEINVDKDLPNP